MKYILSIAFIITALFIFLVWAVNDDIKWFHAFSKSQRNKSAYLKVDTLQYSAYRWRKDPQAFDNELFIAYYIKIYKDGKYVVMRHNSTPEAAQYFKGEIGSAIQNLIDSVSNITLDSTYFSSDLEIYDGNTFQISVSGIKVNKTHFYKVDAPALLHRLATKLDTVIFQSFESIHPFDYSLYQEELKRESINIMGGFPKQEIPRLK